MGQAKLNRDRSFPNDLVAIWEADLCHHFAVALARRTGWLLHIDFLTTKLPSDPKPAEHEIPLRVYVADAHLGIFDARGIFSYMDFMPRIMTPLAQRSCPPGYPAKGIRSQFLSEEKLAEILCPADEDRITKIDTILASKPQYLAAIPKRAEPRLPAYEAARFSLGQCRVFAQALGDLTGRTPVDLCVTRFHGWAHGMDRSADGYVHTLIVNGDGTGEDSWGRRPIEEIARSFGAAEWRFDEASHRRNLARMRANSPQLYDEAYADAKGLIHAHFLR